MSYRCERIVDGLPGYVTLPVNLVERCKEAEDKV